MLLNHDWVVPTFNEQLRTHKPVLLYWCMMSAYQLFGVGEFAARFWSATLAVGTVLATYALGRRLFPANVGFWAAIVLTSSLMFNVAARAATPDSLLIFCSTLALVAYVHTVDPSNWTGSATPGGRFAPLRFRPAVAIYAAMALGVLAKGPVGLVLPTAVLGMFLLIVTQAPRMTAADTPRSRALQWLLDALRLFDPLHFLRTCWAMRPLTALAVCALVAGPWYALVGIRTEGTWLRAFFWEHNVGRAVNPMEGHHGSILYYPVALLVGTFPWSVFTIPLILALRQAFKSDQSRPAFTFLLCWVGVYVMGFSAAQTKLPSYITPTHPAVAVLVGYFLQLCQHATGPRWINWSRVSALTLSGIGLALVVALPWAAHVYLPGDEALGLLGAIPLVGGLATSELLRRQRVGLAIPLLSVTATLFTVGLFGIVAPQVSHHQQIDRLLQLADRGARPAPLGSYGSQEPSWVFYADRAISAFGGEQPQRAVEFLKGDPQRCLITTQQHFRQLQPQLPASVLILGRVPYFLRDDWLLLLGSSDPRAGPPAETARRPDRRHAAETEGR